MGENTQKETQTVFAYSATSIVRIVGIPCTYSVADNFAQDWFMDALNEAQTGKDHNSIRREIIFVACFLESYIFEWTRSKVDLHELNDYFPPTRSKGSLKDKWKEVFEKLFKSNKIACCPKPDFSALGMLVEYRNGLVHARASRPTQPQPKKAEPFPTKRMLNKLKPGWAVKIAVDFVKELHEAIGEPLPDYIEYP